MKIKRKVHSSIEIKIQKTNASYFVNFLAKVCFIPVTLTALNKPFMEVDGIGQLSRFHCIINYGTQIVSLKKSQSAANIWNFP